MAQVTSPARAGQLAAIGLAALAALAAWPAHATRSMAEIVAAAAAADWRDLDDAHTIYLELPAGRVVIELEQRLAPRTVAAVEALVRQGWFDGLSIDRVQDNFVAQWGDPRGKRTLRYSQRRLEPEFSVPLADHVLALLPDADGYAREVGFIDSFPAARDPASGQGWLVHCYGAVGVGRDDDPASGTGAELYAVIGHAPRQLDRNVTVIGRVRQGIELLAALPRGAGDMGAYAEGQARPPIRQVRVAADLPAAQRTRLQVLRTGTASFDELVESRRNRGGSWYRHAAGYIDLCSVPLPVRTTP